MFSMLCNLSATITSCNQTQRINQLNIKNDMLIGVRSKFKTAVEFAQEQANMLNKTLLITKTTYGRNNDQFEFKVVEMDDVLDKSERVVLVTIYPKITERKIAKI